MTTIVQKYGGSSVADPDKIKLVAQAVARRKAEGCQIVVVVSAMGKTTDELLARAKALSKSPPRRELDMLLSAGERISSALLAIALADQGVEAVSLTGSQCGIITNDRHVDARIIEVRPVRIQDELERGRVVIVAGFQGMSYRRDVTTLGRGGSDTTAVALAAALGADACEIYSDVDGVLSTDPRLVAHAQKIDIIGYPEMQELACAGAKVLNAQAVEFAKRAQIALYARQTGNASFGTLVRLDPPPPSGGVRGIAHRERMLVLRCAPAAVTTVFELLDQHTGAANFTAWIGGATPQSGQVELWCVRDNIHGEGEFLRQLGARVDGVQVVEGSGAVSLIGEGIMDDGEHLQQALRALAEAGLTAQGLTTSSFRISILLPSSEVAPAVKVLHDRFISSAPLAVSAEM
jgi:aspartate kinase